MIAFQEALEQLPNIRENFGPYWLHKCKQEHTDPANPQHIEKLKEMHQNHIHFSIEK